MCLTASGPVADLYRGIAGCLVAFTHRQTRSWHDLHDIALRIVKFRAAVKKAGADWEHLVLRFSLDRRQNKIPAYRSRHGAETGFPQNHFLVERTRNLKISYRRSL